MRKKIDQLLAVEGTAAENYQMPEKLPSHIRVSQPNLGHSTVVSVRLSATEHAQLQNAAQGANLPLSTLIRLWALDRLRSDQDNADNSVAQRLARLEQAVFPHSA